MISAVPLLSLLINSGESVQVTAVENTTDSTTGTKEQAATTGTKTENDALAADNSSFKIYDTSAKKVITVSDIEFCCGALATETEADIPIEALKAQAVALHTYYSYLRSESRKANKEYDFQCNSKIWDVYASKEDIKEKWGDTFEESYNAIEDAVKSVSDTFVLYNDNFAMTKYFEISSGTTESYKEVYGEDIAYLTNVPSPYDTVANNYKTTLNFTVDDFDKAIKSRYNDYKPNSDYSKNIGNIKKNSYGAVLSITVGNKEIQGYELCEILNLRSKNFEIECKENNYIFTMLGYGDNIGLSKFGSCQMAKQGSTYLEILQYYYPNTKIVNGYAPI